MDGHLISLYKIGDMYKNGLYVEKDEVEAFCIFRHCEELMDDEQEEEVGADIYIRLADCYYYASGTERDLGKALRYYQKAEQLYHPRLRDGDFMYKKQYERSMAMQEVVREELQKAIPSYDWVKNK